MNKREKLFEIFDNFMDNKYRGDTSIEVTVDGMKYSGKLNRA